MNHDATCRRCGMCEETEEHLFFLGYAKGSSCISNLIINSYATSQEEEKI